MTWWEIVTIGAEELARARRLLDPAVSLDSAYRQINEARSLPTPQTVVEAIMYCVREQGLAALKEPAVIDRLGECDAAAKAQIDCRVAKFIAAKEIVDG
jgi:hypothetical protein